MSSNVSPQATSANASAVRRAAGEHWIPARVWKEACPDACSEESWCKESLWPALPLQAWS
jgi:hypothetical protein